MLCFGPPSFPEIIVDRVLTCCSALPGQAEVVREKVQDGLSGEMKEISYTQCKIVGNGSFGVVFQTKMMPDGEDAAIKRVLQDKRFKVRPTAMGLAHPLSLSPRRQQGH